MSGFDDIAAANDPDWRMRIKAVRSLSGRDDAARQEALEGLLSDSNTAVVDAATEALIESRFIDGLRVALRNVDHPDNELGDNLNMVLQYYDGSGRFPILDWLRDLRTDDDADTRRRADKALAWLRLAAN